MFKANDGIGLVSLKVGAVITSSKREIQVDVSTNHINPIGLRKVGSIEDTTMM